MYKRSDPLPQLPPLNSPYVHRRVFTNADNAQLSFRGEKFIEHVVCEALWRRLSEEDELDLQSSTPGSTSSSTILVMSYNDTEIDDAMFKQLHRITLSTERLLKWTMLYGFDDKIMTPGHDFEPSVYCNVFKAYVGGLLTEGAIDSQEIREWLEALIQRTLESDLKKVCITQAQESRREWSPHGHSHAHLSGAGGYRERAEPRGATPGSVPKNMSEEEHDEMIKFSKDFVYKTLNPLRFQIDYKVLDSSVPPQSPMPWFRIACLIDGHQVTVAEGTSKAKAGNRAAYDLLMKTKWTGNETVDEIRESVRSLVKQATSKGH